ncbi:MAG: AAA family ATPase [bacterium]|nr:AAA family ATPase [bacterium]
MAQTTNSKSGVLDQIERERKFAVEVDPRFFARKRVPQDILQRYMPTAPDHELRVRRINGRRYKVTRKEGIGYSRPEREAWCNFAAAQIILESCGAPIEKDRYKVCHRGRTWELDIFKKKLAGLKLIELENVGRDEILEFPRHILPVKEVTYSISNRHLARFIEHRDHGSELKSIDELIQHRLGRCVLTGGPCAGKSTIIALCRVLFGDILHCMPEIATMVISTMGVKPPADVEARRRFQRGVLQLQLDFESISELQVASDGKRCMLTDRGALDVVPYFPGGIKEFDAVTRLNREWLHHLYDMVIYVEVPPREVYEREKDNNPARYETYEQAVRTGRATLQAWRGHPNLHVIDNQGGWPKKQRRVVDLVRQFVDKYQAA